MQASKFQTTQAPLRERYRNDAPAARLTLKARGTPGEDTITCKVETGKGLAVAGIHPKAGGSGLELCSGDMLQVGFEEIRLRFDVATDAPEEKRQQLLALVERYCVVFQTLSRSPRTDVRLNVMPGVSSTGGHHRS